MVGHYPYPIVQKSPWNEQRLTVPCMIRDVDGTDVRFSGGTNKTYHQRTAGDTASTHAQPPPTLEASPHSQHQQRLSRSALTLPRSSTHSRRSQQNETENDLTPEHATLSRSMVAMTRRPSPSSHSPTGVLQSTSDKQHVRHSSVTTLPRRTFSSESPSIKVAPIATDQSSYSRAQQQQQNRSQSSAGKTHKRSHSLASYSSTTIKPMSASNQVTNI